MTKLMSKDESLTPNGLYVGVATLASMVFTRYRMYFFVYSRRVPHPLVCSSRGICSIHEVLLAKDF